MDKINCANIESFLVPEIFGWYYFKVKSELDQLSEKVDS